MKSMKLENATNESGLFPSVPQYERCSPASLTVSFSQMRLVSPDVSIPSEILSDVYDLFKVTKSMVNDNIY